MRIGRYKRLMEKLNYLIVIRSDITFAVSVVIQFLPASRVVSTEGYPLESGNENFKSLKYTQNPNPTLFKKRLLFIFT